MNPDGTLFEIYARGIRNTVGFDWDQNEKLWFTDNERWIRDDIPPDELNYAPQTALWLSLLSWCDPVYGKSLIDTLHLNFILGGMLSYVGKNIW